MTRRLLLLGVCSAALATAQLSPLDTAVSPCTNFYQYACGVWRAKNPIPSDQARWSRFNELNDRNLLTLQNILEKASSTRHTRSASEQKIGDYYASCMDEKAIDAKGITPLKPQLDQISRLSDKKQLADVLASLHRSGVSAMFGFGSGQDYKDSSEVIARADQGGLGLPDRDYYLKQDPKSVETRQKYEAFVKKIFELLDSPETAQKNAATVLRIETELAQASMDRVSRRNPNNTYHRMTRAQLEALAPAFDWPKYFEGIHLGGDSINVVAPDFFRNLEKMLAGVSLDDWKIYLTFHLVRSNASLLSTPFVNASFDFYDHTLGGAKELRPRWKRCVEAVDSDLGEALGEQYVKETFGGNAKERMAELVANLEKALAEDIETLDWMTPETKKQALAKLHTVANKVGYPEKWRDYSNLNVVRGDALGNSQRANAFEFHRQLAKIGRPVDKKEWGMTPPTVNAYYSPLQNNINFPAGILQPPFFSAKIDDAVNYGGIGAVIGHELTHGFDDQGRRFDAQGNLRDWWTEQDAKEFEKRAQCVSDQYSGYTAVEDVKLNGKLTLGENTADLGGLRIAYMALMESLKNKRVAKIDGFTPQQRFFLGWAQVWCQNITDENARLRAFTDPHSPGMYRTNGVVSNMPEFAEAWGCKVGQPMVREPACRVW